MTGGSGSTHHVTHSVCPTNVGNSAKVLSPGRLLESLVVRGRHIFNGLLVYTLTLV